MLPTVSIDGVQWEINTRDYPQVHHYYYWAAELDERKLKKALSATIMRLEAIAQDLAQHGVSMQANSVHLNQVLERDADMDFEISGLPAQYLGNAMDQNIRNEV